VQADWVATISTSPFLLPFKKMTLPTPEEVEASSEIFVEGWRYRRRVVGLEDCIVKYGTHVYLSEVDSLSFVSSNTTIPSPKYLGSYSYADKTYLFMSRLPGKPLSHTLSTLSQDELNIITSELKMMMDELRSLRINQFETSYFIGSLNGGPCRDNLFSSGYESKGPFSTEAKMYDNIIERWNNTIVQPRLTNPEMQFQRRLYAEISGTELRFTHGDLSPGNILIENGHVSGIVDWEQSGWYPAYWEYIKTMYADFDHWDTQWPLDIAKFLEPFNFALLVDKRMRNVLR
jgi:aminoglycoside phosphotransferase